MAPRKYTLDTLGPIVAEASSVAQVLERLGLRKVGSIHGLLSKRIRELGLDTSHFVRYPGNSGGSHKLLPESVTTYDRCKGFREKPSRLRRAMLESGVPYQCVVCALSEWKSKPIRLHVDHINGDPLDNNLLNLRFLCPNCHSQTPTYGFRGGKGKKAH